VFSNFTPAPAATKEARVEILKVSFRHRLFHIDQLCYSPINQHVYTIQKSISKTRKFFNADAAHHEDSRDLTWVITAIRDIDQDLASLR
jgi:hypothetical protein